MMCAKGDDNVVAVPGGPYQATRGQKVPLNGSRSKGKIEKWTWTLSPGDGCPSGVPTKTVSGAVASVTVLCSLQAKLRVENSRKSDEKTTTVTVKARPGWKTTVPATNAVGTWISANPLVWGCTVGGCQLGRNVCAIHGGSEDTHDIVHQKDPATYEDDAYKLGTVTDAQSPFDGWNWVVANLSRINRKSLLNPELMVGSDTARANAGSGDYLALVQSVKAHEQFHSDIYREQLAQHGDPAVKIEEVIGPDHD